MQKLSKCILQTNIQNQSIKYKKKNNQSHPPIHLSFPKHFSHPSDNPKTPLLNKFSHQSKVQSTSDFNIDSRKTSTQNPLLFIKHNASNRYYSRYIAPFRGRSLSNFIMSLADQIPI